MGRGTLARLEIYAGLIAIAAMFLLAGYGLVSAFAVRLDPKVRSCVEHTMRGDIKGKPTTKEFAEALCRRLEAEGAL